ncbi:MAG: hypothetical protein Q8O00_11500 [Holophaga sp.]|nr:hypothetical protein [Holophaga sp.]
MCFYLRSLKALTVSLNLMLLARPNLAANIHAPRHQPLGVMGALHFG